MSVDCGIDTSIPRDECNWKSFQERDNNARSNHWIDLCCACKRKFNFEWFSQFSLSSTTAANFRFFRLHLLLLLLFNLAVSLQPKNELQFAECKLRNLEEDSNSSNNNKKTPNFHSSQYLWRTPLFLMSAHLSAVVPTAAQNQRRKIKSKIEMYDTMPKPIVGRFLFSSAQCAFVYT